MMIRTNTANATSTIAHTTARRNVPAANHPPRFSIPAEVVRYSSRHSWHTAIILSSLRFDFQPSGSYDLLLLPDIAPLECRYLDITVLYALEYPVDLLRDRGYFR